MRRGLIAVLLAAIALAGCTAGTPEEAGPTDDEPAAREVAPVETAPSVTPTIEYTVTAEGRTIAPEPAPAPVAPIAEPAPAPAPAQAPAPPPEAPAPAAEPAPVPAAPAPSPPPAPTPTPTPSPAPSPTPAAPTPPPPAPAASATWPREGSHVSYTTRVGQAFAGSQQSRVVYSNLSWTYTDGDWRGECVAQVHDDMDGDGVVTVTEERRTYTAASPPHWPLLNTKDPPAVGEDVTTWTAEGCTLTSDAWTYAGESDGVHRATSTAEDVPYEFSTTWDADSGVVLRWHWTKAGSSAPRTESGELVATDAP